MNAIRWNVAVSADTDQALRMLLASQRRLIPRRLMQPENALIKHNL